MIDSECVLITKIREGPLTLRPSLHQRKIWRSIQACLLSNGKGRH